MYSRTSLTWTPKGWTKSVHISEVSTVVKLRLLLSSCLAYYMLKLNGPLDKCPQERGVHIGGVSTGRGSTVVDLIQSAEEDRNLGLTNI